MSDLMDLISQLDAAEIDEEIEEAERRLAILRSLRKSLTAKAPRAKPTTSDPRAAASIPEEIRQRIALRALDQLRRRSPVLFHDLRNLCAPCSPAQLSAALAHDWFVKAADGYSLSAAGEKAVRENPGISKKGP